MSRTIWHDGELVSGSATRIRTDDGGFLRGDGLFETLLVREGTALAVHAHVERLFDGLARLSLNVPESPSDLAAAVRSVASDAPRPFARLRITVTAGTASGGPTRVVEAWPYEPPSTEQRRGGVDVVRCARFRMDRGSGLAGLKSTSYQLNEAALREARSRGAYEGLLNNDAGDVVEGTRSNVMMLLEDAWVTPSVDSGCLPGTVRAVLLLAGVVREATVSASRLVDVSEMVLTNSLVGALPVRCVDGRRLTVTNAAARFAAIVDRQGLGTGGSGSL